MPQHTLLLSRSPGELRAALLEDDLTVELHHVRSGEPQAGDIYRARVTAVDAAIGGAFLDLGGMPGFLGFQAGGRHVSAGDLRLVQVRHPPADGKPAGLATRIELAGASMVLTPTQAAGEIAVSRRLPAAERDRLRGLVQPFVRAGESWTVRTEAYGSTDLSAEMEALRLLARGLKPEGAVGPALVEDPLERLVRLCRPDEVLTDHGPTAAALRRLDPALTVRHDGGGDLFERHGAQAALEEALDIEVPLAGGGSLAIESTRALVAIDVDGGGRSGTEANDAAIGAIARQLRLRGLAGTVLIDFIRDRRAPDLEERLAAALLPDAIPSQVLGWSKGGLLELTRTRTGPSLAERLSGSAAAALDGLRALALAPPGRQLVLPPGAAAWLDQRPAIRAEAEERLGSAPRIRVDQALSARRFLIEE